MDNSLIQVILKIEELLQQKERIVLSISGFGGSGKSTLANKIKAEFPDANLIKIDDFLINHGQGEGWSGGYDWNRYEQVLKDVHDGKDLHYQWYNWPKDSLDERWIDEKLSNIVVVEDIRILQPKFMPYYDLSIWIDCDIETATQRGITRDRVNWEDKSNQEGLEAHLAYWQNVWVPQENEFFELFHPDTLASLRIKN